MLRGASLKAPLSLSKKFKLESINRMNEQFMVGDGALDVPFSKGL